MKRILAIIFVMVISSNVQAGLIFDFKCDDLTCGGDSTWGGFFEFTEASVAAGTAIGATDILDFSFTTSDKGGLEWVLGNFPNDHSLSTLTIVFDVSRTTITSIDGGNSVNCYPPQAPAPCVQINAISGVDTLGVTAVTVFDVNNSNQNGQWVLRVPTPGTLAIMGLGLAGIGFSRRKKA